MTTLAQPDDTGPYGQAAQVYLDLGWQGVLPCDLGGKPGATPENYTGGKPGKWGNYPTPEVIGAWLKSSRRNANIGLRLPNDVVVIDVDCYGDKAGCEQLALLENMVGDPMPATWYSTSRGADSPARKLFYRVPEYANDRRWMDADDDVEVLHHGWRFARVWPSIAMRTGEVERWYNAEGQVSLQPPRKEDLTELPPEWVSAFLKVNRRSKAAQGETRERVESAGDGEAFDWNHWYMLDSISSRDCAEIGYSGQDDLLARAAMSLWSTQTRDIHAIKILVDLVLKFENEPGHAKGDWTVEHAAEKWEKVKELPAPDQGKVSAELKAWSNQVDAGILDGWLDVTDLDQLVAPSYLVKGLLDRPVVALLHGDGGVGKSFMSLDVALHVALGRQWRGHRVREARVAYVYTEGPAYAHRRVAAWCQVNETSSSELKGKLLVYPRPLDLLGPSEPLEAFSAWVRKAGVGLVVFDTFRRNTVGGDENSAKDVSKALHWASRIVQSDATCLIIHHDNKSGGYSGSTTLHGHVDTRIHLTRHEHDDSIICIESEKERESEREGVTYGRLESVQLGVDDDGDPFGSAVFVEADEPQRVATPQGFVSEVALEEQIQRLLEIVGKKPGCSARHIRENLGVKVARVPYVIEVTLERGLIRTELGARNAQLHYVI